jgi:hypothetical protein
VPEPSITSSWISAQPCSSSRLAAAVTIGASPDASRTQRQPQ